MSKENVMQNQEVSAALDLLISTLSDERNRIYDTILPKVPLK